MFFHCFVTITEIHLVVSQLLKGIVVGERFAKASVEIGVAKSGSTPPPLPPLSSVRPVTSEWREQQFGALQGRIKSRHCPSVRFVSLASPPVRCSNTGLKKINQKSQILMRPSNVPNSCSCHSDTGLLLCNFHPFWPQDYPRSYNTVFLGDSKRNIRFIFEWGLSSAFRMFLVTIIAM